MTAKSGARPQLPPGLSPKEEADWWYQHRDELFPEDADDSEYEVVHLRVRRTAPANLRLPVDLLDALKHEAARQGISHQWLIKTWLEERLAQQVAADEPVPRQG